MACVGRERARRPIDETLASRRELLALPPPTDQPTPDMRTRSETPRTPSTQSSSFSRSEST